MDEIEKLREEMDRVAEEAEKAVEERRNGKFVSDDGNFSIEVTGF